MKSKYDELYDELIETIPRYKALELLCDAIALANFNIDEIKSKDYKPEKWVNDVKRQLSHLKACDKVETSIFLAYLDIELRKLFSFIYEELKRGEE